MGPNTCSQGIWKTRDCKEPHFRNFFLIPWCFKDWACAAFFRNTFQSWGPHTPRITTFMMELELNFFFEIPSLESEFLFCIYLPGSIQLFVFGDVYGPRQNYVNKNVFCLYSSFAVNDFSRFFFHERLSNHDEGSQSFVSRSFPFLSIFAFFPFRPWFPSNRDDFALNGMFHNYFCWVLIMEKYIGKKVNYSINRNNLAHTSHTTQCLFSLSPP